MPESFWSMQHAKKLMGKKAWYPPLGLLTIASMLPSDWQIELIDLNVQKLSEKDFEGRDFIFVSAMNVQEESAREIISLANKMKIKVVAGGTLFTHEYEEFPTVDHFILNEAEITLAPFIEDLEKNNLQKIYQSDQYADVHTTPVPRWDLIDSMNYQYAIVQYSRGCPYLCDFCDVTALFGRAPRTKNPDQIIAELEAIIENGDYNFVLFADDNLIGNKRHLKTVMLPALIEWRKKRKPSLYFATQVTVNLADDEELMQLMLDAGFRHIFVGIETPDEDSLAESRKTQNLRRNLLDSIKTLHSSGFIVVGGFIVGFDSDKPDIFQKQIDFVEESGIILSTMNILKAPPGTELYERMKKEKRLIERFSFQETRTNFIPKMSPEVLENGFKKIVTRLYSPESVYERILTFLSIYEYPQTEIKIPDPSPAKYLLPILNVIFKIGIAGPERKYFWKLLFLGLRKYPNKLDHVVLNLVMMHQLRKLRDSIIEECSNKT